MATSFVEVYRNRYLEPFGAGLARLGSLSYLELRRQGIHSSEKMAEKLARFT